MPAIPTTILKTALQLPSITTLLFHRRRIPMLSELEYLLKTHGEEQARSDQSSLRDVLMEVRHLADDLGLDFGSALAGSDGVCGDPATMEAFDPRI
jgi:hypothetical protein